MPSQLRFDGSAATLLRADGVSKLRSSSRKQPTPSVRFHTADLDKLDRISLEDHGSVSKDRYFECARSKQAQADGVAAQIKELEISGKKPEKLAALRQAYSALRTESETARKLAYARRSGVTHLLAKLGPKKRRDIILWTMATGGFVINVLWVPYLMHIYKKMASDLEKQAV